MSEPLDSESEARIDEVLAKVDALAESFRRPGHEDSEAVRNHPLFTPEARAERKVAMREELRETLRGYMQKHKP